MTEQKPPAAETVTTTTAAPTAQLSPPHVPAPPDPDPTDDQGFIADVSCAGDRC